ncbi:hypothetical protein [Candidatus Accumulibacter contiguus]|uniref:hypothetical protein n=1 Tax=Candidatus Accumulibacter contiguus TaxID=2954381 RepID=UPI002FC2FCB3
MWAGEVNAGDLALLRIPLASFSDGRDSAPAQAYRRLPRASGYVLQSRYIGPYLLYGAGTGWHSPQTTTQSQVYAVRYAQGEVYELPLPHSVDRVEALGSNALVVGSRRQGPASEQRTADSATTGDRRPLHAQGRRAG